MNGQPKESSVKKNMSVGVLGLMLVMLAGCATGPTTPINTLNLCGDHVVYIEQNNRIPVAVPLAAWGNESKSNEALMARGIDPAVYAELIKELAKMFPEMAKTYSTERMNESLTSDRVLIKGDYTPEQWSRIVEMVRIRTEYSEKCMPKK
jgi:hypothetical protein